MGRFFVRLASKSEKVQIWPTKKLFEKKVKKVSKNAKFHADFKSIEKVQKISQKSYKQNRFEEYE